MANELRFVGGELLFVDGDLAMSEDCCCDGCTATTAQGICEYLRDNGYLANLTVGTGDYDDTCLAGDCTGIDGSYSLPYLSNSGGTDTHQISWEDSFAITACTFSQTITVTVTLTLNDVGAAYTATLAVTLRTASTSIDCEWEDSFEVDDCVEVTGLMKSLPATESVSPTSRCRTVAATSGPVDVAISQ